LRLSARRRGSPAPFEEFTVADALGDPRWRRFIRDKAL